MADPEGESLESWLNKATNPSNRKEEWEYIIGFCDQMNKELEGPQISVRLLAHKIQSPQEWESLQALIVLEACMKNCGKRFHNEVGKFRFLNELIKIVSPKYLGDRVSERVKTKVIEMLYSWSVALPEEAKITEAYRMLKNKGIVTADPDIHVDRTIVSSPQPKNPVFDNEEKSKRLAELLKSKKPEDLQEANRIIKNMVKEDEARQQKVSQRVSTLEEVNNSVKLLNEMLSHFKSDESTQADKELLKDLYNDCDKLRTAVFKLATETEDDDSALGDILHASDDLSRVINSYKKIVEGQTIIVDTSGSTATKHTNDGNSSEVLIDMADLDSGASSPLKQFMPPPQDSLPADLFTLTPLVEALPSFNNSGLSGLKINKNESSNSASTSQLLSGLSLLDEELCTLGLGNLEKSMSAEKNKKEEHSNQWISAQTSKPVIDLLCSSTPLNPLISTAPRTSKATSLTGSESSLLTAESSASAFFQESCADQNKSNSYSSFVVGEGNTHTALTAFSLPTGIAPVPSPLTTGKPQSFTPDSPLFRSLSPTPSSHMPSSSGLDISLTSVYVPLEAIKPSKESPVTAYDKDGVRVLLHLATNHPPGRPDVLVIVVSMLNTAPLLVKNLVLQAAVPKSMRIKLQPPSGTEMGPFNPLLPPSSITQIMLLANPLREKVRMRYKLTFMLGDQQVTETGEMDVFPHLERWGH